MSENLQVIIAADEIAARVSQLGNEIRESYQDQEVTVVGLLEDSFVFLADLIRAMNMPVACCFLKASKHQSGGHTDILYTTEFDPHGRNILLVGGILDTGVTLDYLERQFTARGAKSIKAVVLVDKPNFRTTDFTADFVGFVRPEEMLVGYGLGISDRYRYLPYLATVESE
jgi:hypoxanthine phosphoribosyltransferase